MTTANQQINRNIMEVLVEEEIERQLNRYSDNVIQQCNRIEVATFALNRLPALYASCYQGFNQQKLKGRKKHSADITKAVRQAFAAVQQDLLRNSNPLIAEENSEFEEAQKALQELADFLPNQEFSWKKLVELIKPVLVKLSYEDGLNIADEIRDTGSKEKTESDDGWENSPAIK